MRIAQIAPLLIESKTSSNQVLAQQLIGDLTEALTERGHQVVLYSHPDLHLGHGIGCASARRLYASRVLWYEKAFFSDQTFDYLRENDRSTYEAITAACQKWDNVDIVHRGETIKIDSRPSDAIALGVAGSVPIYVADHVLAEVSM
jgi:triacylglycerol esterase/lipase EstA (alpha/beta hydrolase family)